MNYNKKGEGEEKGNERSKENKVCTLEDKGKVIKIHVVNTRVENKRLTT